MTQPLSKDDLWLRQNSTLPLCNHTDHQSMRLTWVNARTGEQDTGPICMACAGMVWDQLAAFPDARDSFTIHPVKDATA